MGRPGAARPSWVTLPAVGPPVPNRRLGRVATATSTAPSSCPTSARTSPRRLPYYGGIQQIFPPDWENSTGDAIGFVASHNNGSTWSAPTTLGGITSADCPEWPSWATRSTSRTSTPRTVRRLPGRPIRRIGPLAQRAGYRLPERRHELERPDHPARAERFDEQLGDEPEHRGEFDRNRRRRVRLRTGRAWRTATTSRTRTSRDQIVYSAPRTMGRPGRPPPWRGTLPGSRTLTTTTTTGPLRHVCAVDDDPADVDCIQRFGAIGLHRVLRDLLQVVLLPAHNWEYSGVFASASTDGGASWTSRPSRRRCRSAITTTCTPAVAVSGNTAYLAYVWSNDTYCYGTGCSPFDDRYSSWLASSTNGSAWQSTFTNIAVMPSPYYTQAAFQGGTPRLSSTAPATRGGHDTARPLQLRLFEQRHDTGLQRDVLPNVTIVYQYAAATTHELFVENNLQASRGASRSTAMLRAGTGRRLTSPTFRSTST